MPRILKECFGTVISSLKKMKECVRCELLAECRAINWQSQDPQQGPAVIHRRPGSDPGGEDDARKSGPA
jgi:hypothetical protein